MLILLITLKITILYLYWNSNIKDNSKIIYDFKIIKLKIKIKIKLQIYKIAKNLNNFLNFYNLKQKS